MKTAAAALLIALVAVPAFAQRPQPEPAWMFEVPSVKPLPPGQKAEPVADPYEDKVADTSHVVRIGGQEVRYTASAGSLPLSDGAGKVLAHVFFVAYTRDGAGDASARPITFAFNGGPGSASVWLHMGALGPRRVQMAADGFQPAPPFKLVDNEWSILDVTDLVMIDPVSTGYSRAAAGQDPHAFHGSTPDIQSVAEFVRTYITRYKRWASPKYVLGESYGTTRAAGLNIPPALMDRMEIIRIAGYTEDEKVQIARRHLIPAQTKAHGLETDEWSLDDDALKEIIRRYTREAGVRNLEREIAKMSRKSVKELLTTKKKSIHITLKNLEDYLGVQKYRYGEAELEDQVGVVTGLAWTEVGGELLTVEGVMMPGKGKMTVTGNLRDVMKESIQAANAYVRSRAVEFGIKPPLFEKRDIHVHVPEGATPKDGPSAGVAMVTAIVSMMTGIPVKRDVAMTGEITLRGRVLPIGGLKEKLLAALRAGIKTVIIPEENAKDLTEIPDELKNVLDIRTVSRMDEVVKIAFVRPLQPIAWEEEGEETGKIVPPKEETPTGVTAH